MNVGQRPEVNVVDQPQDVDRGLLSPLLGKRDELGPYLTGPENLRREPAMFFFGERQGGGDTWVRTTLSHCHRAPSHYGHGPNLTSLQLS